MCLLNSTRNALCAVFFETLPVYQRHLTGLIELEWTPSLLLRSRAPTRGLSGIQSTPHRSSRLGSETMKLPQAKVLLSPFPVPAGAQAAMLPLSGHFSLQASIERLTSLRTLKARKISCTSRRLEGSDVKVFGSSVSIKGLMPLINPNRTL